MPYGKEKVLQKSKEKPVDGNLAGNGTKQKGDRSERDAWWRGSLKDSPNPGRYQIRGFIEEANLNPIRMTYGFQGVGRNVPVRWVRKGDLLLPGAYQHTDFIQETLRHRASCSFKSCPRPQNDTLGIRDKDIDLSPGQYDVTEKPVSKLPCKHGMFRSAVQRQAFVPREGPPPGQYNVRTQPTHAISSCFKSTVPRLHCTRSIYADTGTYKPNTYTTSVKPKKNINTVDLKDFIINPNPTLWKGPINDV